MKKFLYFINKNDGFILPYVLFIAALIFIVLTANLKIYNLDIEMTNQHLEQLKIESIIQMGRSMVKKDLLANNNLESIHYIFPDGTIEIAIVKLEDLKYHLHMTVLTNNLSHYTITNQLYLPN